MAGARQGPERCSGLREPPQRGMIHRREAPGPSSGCGLRLSRPARRRAPDAARRRPAQRQPDRGGLRGPMLPPSDGSRDGAARWRGRGGYGMGERSQVGVRKLRLKPQPVGRKAGRNSAMTVQKASDESGADEGVSSRRLSQLPLAGLRVVRESSAVWAHMLPTPPPKSVRNGLPVCPSYR